MTLHVYRTTKKRYRHNCPIYVIPYLSFAMPPNYPDLTAKKGCNYVNIRGQLHHGVAFILPRLSTIEDVCTLATRLSLTRQSKLLSLWFRVSLKFQMSLLINNVRKKTVFWFWLSLPPFMFFSGSMGEGEGTKCRVARWE